MSKIKAETMLPSGIRLRVIHSDLTQVRVGAIVNAANANLAHGGGVAGAIVRQGGRVIQEESDAWVRKHGPLTHRSPAITSAGRLPCEYVIHAVGPVWGEGDEDRKLHDAVYGALEMASGHGVDSVALPAISTGIYGFPKERAATVILDSILQFFKEEPDTEIKDVLLVLIDEPSLQIFEHEFAVRWAGSVLKG